MMLLRVSTLCTAARLARANDPQAERNSVLETLGLSDGTACLARGVTEMKWHLDLPSYDHGNLQNRLPPRLHSVRLERGTLESRLPSPLTKSRCMFHAVGTSSLQLPMPQQIRHQPCPPHRHRQLHSLVMYQVRFVRMVNPYCIIESSGRKPITCGHASKVAGDPRAQILSVFAPLPIRSRM